MPSPNGGIICESYDGIVLYRQLLPRFIGGRCIHPRAIESCSDVLSAQFAGFMTPFPRDLPKREINGLHSFFIKT